MHTIKIRYTLHTIKIHYTLYFGLSGTVESSILLQRENHTLYLMWTKEQNSAQLYNSCVIALPYNWYYYPTNKLIKLNITSTVLELCFFTVTKTSQAIKMKNKLPIHVVRTIWADWHLNTWTAMPHRLTRNNLIFDASWT